MKTTLRTVLTLLLGIALYLCFTPTASADTVDSGTWGDLGWVLDDDGLLSISGNGQMDDFDYDSSSAWRQHADSIATIVIGSSVTSISDGAFHNLTTLQP